MMLLALEVGLRLFGYGYRHLNYPESGPDEGVSTILCIGESSTIGWGVQKDESYPAQLEYMLNQKAGGKRFRVVVAGDMGANSSKMLARLPQALGKYRPKTVIVMVGANNFLDLDKSNVLLFSKSRSVSHGYFTLIVLLSKSRAYKLARHIYLDAINYSYEEGDSKYDHSRAPAHHREIFDKILAHDLEQMTHICAANGIELIISGYPLGQHRDIHKSIADKFSVPFVDNALFFEKLKQAGNLDSYLLDDHWHPNKAGYEIIAKNIIQTL